jgi:hypothetical protein
MKYMGLMCLLLLTGVVGLLSACSSPCGPDEYLHPRYGCKSEPTGLLYILSAVIAVAAVGVIWNNLKNIWNNLKK